MARYYPVHYRSDVVSPIVGALDQGMCVSVIGPPSVGKSNLLKFLDQERVNTTDPDSPWLRYAPNAVHKGRLISISLDPNALLPPLPDDKGSVAATAWPGFELLVHRMTVMPELYPAVHHPHGQPVDGELAARIARLQEQFENAHLSITDYADSLHGHMALRYLESITDAVLAARRVQESPVRLVFIMDEFERMLDTMPDYFFVALRSLRDRFKYQVMFMTFSRSGLPYLIGEGERMLALEPFIELFNDNPVYLGPFGDEDAWGMIQELEKRTVPRDDHPAGLLIRSCGGFAGLIRAGFVHIEALATITDSDYSRAVGLAAAHLAAEANIQAECRTLLRGLTPAEVKTLYGVVHEQTGLDQEALGELLRKSLLAQSAEGSVIRVKPPVLAAFIRNHPTPPPPAPVLRPVTMPR